MQKFFVDMVYGLIAGQSCLLTEIARKRNGEIALDKTVERLSRNLMGFDEAETASKSYIDNITNTLTKRPYFSLMTAILQRYTVVDLRGFAKFATGIRAR